MKNARISILFSNKNFMNLHQEFVSLNFQIIGMKNSMNKKYIRNMVVPLFMNMLSSTPNFQKKESKKL